MYQRGTTHLMLTKYVFDGRKHLSKVRNIFQVHSHYTIYEYIVYILVYSVMVMDLEIISDLG
jgi:hypothetical protein